ncbi:MAG: hypothetical protein LBT47_05185 [Deltaproteobacteria bacterium]|jgi:hypothetical protein|nr:hypothetical protein [Deltaproteobacteria bacterium]
MMRTHLLLISVILGIVLSGCVIRIVDKHPKKQVESEYTEPSFAEQVARQPEGTSNFYADSPIGPIMVETGTTYISGLGSQCRSARGTMETKSILLAVCKVNGAWRFIPTIFDSGAR